MSDASIGPMRALDVAVVIATYRRPDLLTRCLDALCDQTLDATRYEVVVADDDAGNPGAERTLAIVAVRAAAHRARPASAPLVRVVPVTATQGPAGARNAGWRASDARVIAFTDDDTIPDRAWLEEGLRYLATGYDAFGGAIRMPLPDRPTDYERDAAGLSTAEFATANCFVARSALEQVGGFDERFTSAWREDSDLHFALMEAGYRVGQSDRSFVTHPIRPASFGVSIGQQRKVLFDVLLFKKHRQLYRSRILRGPPWSYYVNVVALAIAVGAALAGLPTLPAVASLVWFATTLRFALRRLNGTSRAWSHVVEMLWTSMAIPPLALWWRAVGSVRFRTIYL